MKFCPSQRPNVLVSIFAVFVIFVPLHLFAAPSKLVIDEFQVSGVDTNDEYVSIANYGTLDLNLKGYRLVKRVSSSTNYALYEFTSDYVLKRGCKVILAHEEYLGPHDFDFTANTISDNNAIFLLDASNNTVDLVGYGDAVYFEGVPVSAPGAGDIYSRVSGVDTDNSNADFVLQKVVLAIDINADKLVISELLPNPSSGEEWFELYNPTNQTVSLANLKICDALGARHCYLFNKNDTLLAGMYKSYGQSVTKITLNNAGDWLTLTDLSDKLITDSGGNYESADKGVSLSLFGSTYMWTKTLTPNASNVYFDPIEVETDAETSSKISSKRVSTAKKKKAVVADKGTVSSTEIRANDTGVKAAETTNKINLANKAPISRRTLGWALIGLAILLVLGYTCWYFRDYAREIYDKIRSRDDSARF